MKNKYGIGFLLFLILVVFGITCAYQLSLNKGKREIQAEINAKEQKEMNSLLWQQTDRLLKTTVII